MRPLVAVLLCGALAAPAQDVAIAPVPSDKNIIVRPYVAREVPPVRLDNSARLAQLIRGGALYLTAQDAIALTLENNVELEISRYNPLLGAWRVTRAEAGGALP